MVQRYSIKNKVVRAAFYISSIGGLMMLFAGLLFLCWNHFVADRSQYAPLSFLESVGLVSIAYVVYSSLRFSSIGEECAEHKAAHIMALHQQSAPLHHSNEASSQPSVSALSGLQREQLKKEIERCCGKDNLQNTAQAQAERSA